MQRLSQALQSLKGKLKWKHADFVMVFDLWSGLVFETSCEKSKKCPGVNEEFFFYKDSNNMIRFVFQKNHR